MQITIDLQLDEQSGQRRDERDEDWGESGWQGESKRVEGTITEMEVKEREGRSIQSYILMKEESWC